MRRHGSRIPIRDETPDTWLCVTHAMERRRRAHLEARKRGGRSSYAIPLRVHHSECELFEVGPSGVLEGGFGVGVEIVTLQTASGQEAARGVRWKRRQG